MPLTRIPAGALAIVAVLAAVLPSAPADSRTRLKRCVPDRAQVVRVNATAVIYQDREDEVFGCLRTRGRSVNIGGVGEPLGGDAVYHHHYRLAGRFVAFEREQRGEQPQTTVEVYDLRDSTSRGFVTGPTRSFSLIYGAGNLTDLVLNERGSTAWILANEDDPTTFQVRLARRTGSVQLEMSKEIDPRSLVRKGARGFCWSSAGVQHCRNLYR